MIIQRLRKLLLALAIGFIATLVVACLIDINILGASSMANAAALKTQLLDTDIIFVTILTAIYICYKGSFSVLRSYFINSGVEESVESYLKFFAVIVLVFINPFNGIIYPAYAKVLASYLLIFLLVAILAHLTIFVSSLRRKHSIREAIYIDDKPLNNISVSDLSDSQRKYIEELAEVIQSGYPRSIGLTGPWGSGKTLIYKEARKSVVPKTPDLIWVEFESWRYASEEALVKGFYESIAREIELQTPTYHDIVKTMAKTVNQFINKNATSGLRPFVTAFTDGQYASKPDVIIRNALDRENRRLIVVVDDIERHYSNERIFRTLQLVHHAKSIHNSSIQILCIYEKDAIMNAAPQHTSSSATFLEKFTEMDIAVLPPGGRELQTQIENYLKKYRDILKIDPSFSLTSYEGNIGTIGSYRSVIRIFNNLISTSRSSLHQKYRYDDLVCFGDRFAMAHVKLSYPLVYQDIFINRKYYVESPNILSDISMQMMDDGEKKKFYTKHFDYLMSKSRLSGEEKDTVLEIISNLFPLVAEQLSISSHRLHISETELKSKKMVASSDVLDAYFETTGQIEDYNAASKLVTDSLARVKQTNITNDASLMEIMHNFMIDAADMNIESVSFFLMQQDIRALEGNFRKYRVPILRAWLRAVLMVQGSSNDENRIVIGRILNTLNEIVISSASREPSKEQGLCNEFFKGVTSVMKDPRAALLMLLYLSPQRGNAFFSNYIASELSKPRGLFPRILSTVDKLIIDENINIYQDYDYNDWAFVAYQWAYSIAPSAPVVNPQVASATARYSRARDYLLSLLKDDILAYEVISRRMEDRLSDNSLDGEKFLSTDSFAPFEPTDMTTLLDRLFQSKLLSKNQKDELKRVKQQLNSPNHRIKIRP